MMAYQLTSSTEERETPEILTTMIWRYSKGSSLNNVKKANYQRRLVLLYMIQALKDLTGHENHS